MNVCANSSPFINVTLELIYYVFTYEAKPTVYNLLGYCLIYLSLPYGIVASVHFIHIIWNDVPEN